MNENIKPNQSELKFLDIAYNRFYDLQEEIFDDSFWSKDSQYRYSRIKEIFSVYTELLNYEPIKYVIKQIKIKRPPMEAEISSKLFKFIRNLISHFPFFDSWDTVFFSRELINWKGNEESIHKFLMQYKTTGEVKYRFWEKNKKFMTYLSINFPKNYDNNEIVYLKDILSEKDGMKFSIMMMKQVLDTQVESIK